MNPGIIKLINALLLVVAGFLFLLYASGTDSDTMQSTAPCSEPLTFHMGEIDERFNISEERIAEVLRNVSRAWSEAAGAEVMKFSEDGDVQVNFVYDSQQQMTDRELQFRERLNREEREISRLESEHRQMTERFDQKTMEYRNDSADLQNKIDRMNEWVNEQNSAGGFTEEKLEVFKERESEINREANELNYRAEQLSVMANEINRFMDDLNEKIDQKNRLIKEYNNTFSGTRRFTQGTYQWVGNRRWINVFQFSGQRELELVLAHEMGHAIGIDHVDNPQSVMHHLMGNQSGPELQFTDEDILALEKICGITEN